MEQIYSSYFHLKDNWYFARRIADGFVVIEHWNSHVDKNEGKPADAIVEIPPEGWASIVATVSLVGETRNTWLEALAFHNRPKPIAEYHPTVHDVYHCARCDGEHHDLQYKRFAEPIVDEDGVWSWWATCPTTGDPILMRETNDTTYTEDEV